MLGLALGDALGAPYEGGPLERALWKLIGRTRNGEMRWTDDTQMSLDLAESLIDRGRLDQDDLARRFAAGYRWSRGYGPGAAKLLKRIRRGVSWRDASRCVYPDGSYGNGGAMRAPIIGLYCANDTDVLIEMADASARITHAHPLGVEGAVLIAAAVGRSLTTTDPREIMRHAGGCCSQPEFEERIAIARQWLEEGSPPPAAEVAKRLGRGVAAVESCVTALYLGLSHLARPFVELHRCVAACGGDADTIGAMSGSIWGAVNGATRLPGDLLSRLEQRDRLQRVADALHHAVFDRG